jgi:hypothetical protein
MFFLGCRKRRTVMGTGAGSGALGMDVTDGGMADMRGLGRKRPFGQDIRHTP